MSYPLVLPRVRELERCFQEYEDVPREVTLKEDLLNLGIRFTEPALHAAAGFRRKSYYLFSYNRASFEEMKQQESLHAPEELRFSGGPYGLRPTVISVRLATDSPYRVDRTEDGRLQLLEGNIVLADVEYKREPAWYSRTFPDGVKYGEMVSSIGWGERTLSMVLRHCQMWDEGDQCLYCDLVANVSAIKSMGWPYTIRKRPEYIAQVFRTIYYETDDEPKPSGIQLTGGSLIDREAGHIDDTDFYLDYVRAIKDQVGGRWPLTLQTAALDEPALRKLHAGGVDVHHANIEVWDKRLFEILCPGKTKFVGRDEWIRRVVASVDIFGEGNILPSVVVGVEMSQPYGFKTVEEAVASTSAGMDYLMKHGVIPRPNHWCVEPLSTLGHNAPPPLDYFVQVDRAWYELYVKHRLPPLRGYTMGPGHSTYHVSAVLDMGPAN
jgi:hypothetical protein